MKKIFTLTLLSVACVFSVNAQDSTKTEEPKKFNFSGYIDSYYFSNLNNPANRNNLGASGTARAFDQKSGTIGLGLVQAKMTYAPSAKTDVVVDLVFGPNADLGNYGNAIGPLGGTTSLAIKQAYFNWKPFEKLTITAGQFGTHIGYEVIDAPINYNYSLSNLFNNGPFYHIGAKAQYAFSDKVSLMAGVVNNVDALYDNNRSKGIIGQLFVSPVKGWNVYLNGIYTNEANATDSTVSTPQATYALGDLTTTFQVTDSWLVGLNAAMGSQTGVYQSASFTGAADTTKTWGGVALYSNYAFSSKFSLGARYEVFDNTSGARGLRLSANEGIVMNSATVTATFTTADGHLLIKPEFRMDMSNKDFFVSEKSTAIYDNKSQSTVGLALIYKY
jgi:Putative beta-barrel porin-2, OmpL-like. bbp2